MSNTKRITEYQVIDSWHDLALSKKYVRDKDKIVKCLKDIFASHDLEIVGFKSAAFNTIKSWFRYILENVIDKNRKNPSRSKYFGLKGPEKLFFSTSEFPELCEKDVTKR